MKKSIILCLLFLQFSTVSAQSLTVTGNTTIPNSDPCLQATSYLTVKNISLNTLDIICEKIIIDTAAGTSNFFCWGANCYGSETYISTSHNTLDPGEGDNVDFGGYYDAYCDLATATIQYCFYPDTDPNDKTCITILYNGLVNNTEYLILENENYFYPNPSKGYTNFMHKKSINSSLVIVDILGNTVKEIELLEENSQNIDIQDLNKGVYFGCMIENNKIVSTKKLIVQ